MMRRVETSGPSPQERTRRQVLQSTISRRVAGNWCIWFLRSVSCVWFNARARPASPAYHIDRSESPPSHNAPTLSGLMERRLRSGGSRQKTGRSNQLSAISIHQRYEYHRPLLTMVLAEQCPLRLRVPGVGRNLERGRGASARLYLPARDTAWPARTLPYGSGRTNINESHDFFVLKIFG